MDTHLIERRRRGKKVNHGDLVNLLFSCFDCLTTVISLISIVACNETCTSVSFVGKVKRVSHSISLISTFSPTPFDVQCITNCHSAALFAAAAVRSIKESNKVHQVTLGDKIKCDASITQVNDLNQV